MSNLIYQPPQTEIAKLIVFQNDNFIIVNKPANLLSVPGNKIELQDSLLTRLELYFKTKREKIYLVHRLDMETNGLMIFACNKTNQSELSKMFANRQFNKTYIARVAGKIKYLPKTLKTRMRLDLENKPKQTIDLINGKLAITKTRLIKIKQNSSIVLLKPITGRSHQLRLQMLELGHPILGDSLYGFKEPKRQLQLQSIRLQFFYKNQNYLFRL